MERGATFGAEPGTWLPSGTSRALQDLLVPALRVCPTARALARGCAGPDARLFPTSSSAQSVDPSGSGEGQIPIIFARITAEIPLDRGGTVTVS